MATGLVADKTSTHYCLPLHKRYSFTHFDLTEVFEAVLTFANNSVNMPWTQMVFPRWNSLQRKWLTLITFIVNIENFDTAFILANIKCPLQGDFIISS
jgi:hypothetical protein